MPQILAKYDGRIAELQQQIAELKGRPASGETT
jgi:hypothetical protein